MVRLTMGVLAACCVLALAATNAGAAVKPAGTEFKDGWHTYATAKEGDWADYQISELVQKRFEVKKVEGDKVQLVETTRIKDKPDIVKEGKLKPWWEYRLLSGILPVDKGIEWKDDVEVAVGDAKLKCTRASFTNGSLRNEIFFSKSVPCGGFVKQTMNDNASIWLLNYGDKDHKDGYIKGAGNPNAGKANLPGFYATAGNVAILKTKDGAAETYTRRESESFDGTTATFTDTPCDKDGNALADAKPVETKWTNDDWAKRYGKPSATGQKVKVAAGEYECKFYETVNGSKTTKEWLNEEGLLIKAEIKDGDRVSMIELVLVKMK